MKYVLEEKASFWWHTGKKRRKKKKKGSQHEFLCSALESRKHGYYFWILSLVYQTKSHKKQQYNHTLLSKASLGQWEYFH